MILHLDADAFFASCEQAMNPRLKGRPVVVGRERGIATALSYEAKAAGVVRGMTINMVKKVCPNAIIMPGDYETYSLFSRRMFNIVKRFTGAIEEYSIDEAFADLTGLAAPLKLSYEQLARKIKNSIKEEIGITVSVGLAPTKVLAKIASKINKPDGFAIITHDNIGEFLGRVPVQDIWGVGARTAIHMNQLGIHTAAGFAKKTQQFITSHFYKPHIGLWHELNGRIVHKVNPAAKEGWITISKTKTFTPPSSDKEFVYGQLVQNIENACARARGHNLFARRIIIMLKTQGFKVNGLEIKLARASAFPHELMGQTRIMFEKLFNKKTIYRATGAVLADLVDKSHIEQTLFEEPRAITQKERLYRAIDFLRKKFKKQVVGVFSGTLGGAYSVHAHSAVPSLSPFMLSHRSMRTPPSSI